MSCTQRLKVQCEMRKGDKNTKLTLTSLNISGFIILSFLHILAVGVHLENACRYVMSLVNCIYTRKESLCALNNLSLWITASSFTTNFFYTKQHPATISFLPLKKDIQVALFLVRASFSLCNTNPEEHISFLLPRT